MILLLNSKHQELIDNIFFFFYNLISDKNSKINFQNNDLLYNLIKALKTDYDKLSINVLGS